MKSMTGYGKGEVINGDRVMTIELKSVNNRYLDINTRLPKSLAYCDNLIKKNIQANVKRGSIDVFFNYENRGEGSKEVVIDYALSKEYVETAKKIRTEFMLEYDFNTTALMRSPEVLKIQFSDDDPTIVEKMVTDCTLKAVIELDKMRIVEGRTIHDDLIELTKSIVESLEKVVQRAPKIVAEYRDKIRNRMNDILVNVEVDEVRLLNEVAFFADKCDINEEISRLSSHLNQFLKSMDSKSELGRKLDFISQEINREINTMGSKSNDIELTNLVIFMKNQLEKIKEQIRNVE